MNPRAELLARRRERLVLRSRLLRRQLTREVQAVQPALGWVDRAQDAWIWLRTNPLVGLAAPMLLALWRPRRTMGLGMRLWSVWKLVQGWRASQSPPPSPSRSSRR